MDMFKDVLLKIKNLKLRDLQGVDLEGNKCSPPPHSERDRLLYIYTLGDFLLDIKNFILRKVIYRIKPIRTRLCMKKGHLWVYSMYPLHDDAANTNDYEVKEFCARCKYESHHK